MSQRTSRSIASVMAVLAVSVPLAACNDDEPTTGPADGSPVPDPAGEPDQD